uniref:Putative secreted salivary protein n=1 Tax=Ixodes scapularis TaxID=6945 RepID=Q4PMW8_IXOSC|nr:putative secreted salivary protein [Ixodes scapularis]
MARLICALLAILLADQCADVVNGAVEASSLPSNVGNRESFLQKLKELCFKRYNTRVLASLHLPSCTLICATSAWGIFKPTPKVQLSDNEPCDGSIGKCMHGTCVYIA